MMKSLYRIAGVAALVVSTPAIANDCNLGAVKQVNLRDGLKQTGAVRTADLALVIYRGAYSKNAAFTACSEEEFVSYFTSLNPSEVLQLESVVTLPDVPRAAPAPVTATVRAETPSTVTTTVTPDTATTVVVPAPVPVAVVADQSALRANERKLDSVNAELARVRSQLANRPVSTWTRAQTQRVVVLETAKSNLEKAIIDIKKRLDNHEARLGLIENTVINKDGSSNVYTKAQADAEFLNEQEVKDLIAGKDSADEPSWFSMLPGWVRVLIIIGIIAALGLLLMLGLAALSRRRRAQQLQAGRNDAEPANINVPTDLEANLNALPTGDSKAIEVEVDGVTETITFTKIAPGRVSSDRIPGGQSLAIAGLRRKVIESLKN